MIKKKSDMENRVVENMKGGEKSVYQELFLSGSDMAKHSRLFGKMTLPKGASIGEHQHSGETEYYYILSGKGEVDEKDGALREVGPGDLVITGGGAFHSIKNSGDEDLVFIALIILD